MKAIDTKEEKILSAINIFGLIPKSVSLVLGITFIGYVVGWNETSAYYKAIGSPWAVHMLEPLTFLMNSAGLITIFFSIIYLFIQLVVDEKISYKAMSWLLILVVIIGAICSVIINSNFNWFPHQYLYALAIVCVASQVLTTAIVLGQVVLHHAGETRKFNSLQVTLLFLAISSGILMSPGAMGKARALNDLDPQKTDLPAVNISGSSNKFHLVNVSGDLALLILLPSESSAVSFKVVDAKDILEIFPVEQYSR